MSVQARRPHYGGNAMLPGRCVMVLVLMASLLRAGDIQAPRDGFEFDAELTGRGENMTHGPFRTYSLISGHRDPDISKKEKGKVHTLLRNEKSPLIVLKSINVYLGGKFAAAFD